MWPSSGGCQIQESPHQVQCFGRRVPRHLIHNCPALRFQIVDQRFPILPVHKGALPRDRRQALPDLFGTSTGLSAPAIARRSRRFAAAFPSLTSISSSASRAAPSASRLPAFSVFVVMLSPGPEHHHSGSGANDRTQKAGGLGPDQRIGGSRSRKQQVNGIPTFRFGNEAKR